MPLIFDIVEKCQGLVVSEMKKSPEGRSELFMHFKWRFKSEADITAVQAELSSRADGCKTMRVTHVNDRFMGLTRRDTDGSRMVRITMSDARDIFLEEESDIYCWDRQCQGMTPAKLRGKPLIGKECNTTSLVTYCVCAQHVWDV